MRPSTITRSCVSVCDGDENFRVYCRATEFELGQSELHSVHVVGGLFPWVVQGDEVQSLY